MQCRCSCQNSCSIHNYVVPMLCVHMYCTTVHTDCDCTVVSLTDQSIASIQGTPHTHHTLRITHHTDKVKCWAWVPRLKMPITIGESRSRVGPHDIQIVGASWNPDTLQMFYYSFNHQLPGTHIGAIRAKHYSDDLLQTINDRYWQKYK